MNDPLNWTETNDRHLAATVRWIRMSLENLAQSNQDNKTAIHGVEALEQARRDISCEESHEPPPALVLLGRALGLSGFDRHVLALCAAVELDTRISDLCAKAQGDPNKPWPTFALAFALFDDPEWNALSPHAPLRYWRLLEINQPGALPLTGAALAADERIVNYLKGLNYIDDRLTPLLDPINTEQNDVSLPVSQQQLVDSIIEFLQYSNIVQKPPVIELLGRDFSCKRLIAGSVASTYGLNLYAISLSNLAMNNSDFDTFTRLWQRESLLMPLALYIQSHERTDKDISQLVRYVERNSGIVFIASEDTRLETDHDRLAVEVNKPTPDEQDLIWKEALQNLADGQPQRLSEQFSFNRNDIAHLARTSIDRTTANGTSLTSDLWQACRIRARASMEQLAQRIDAKATWEQLVLPSEQKSLLYQITDQVSRRKQVYEDWGFREKMNRGLGINALFAGESGTGKTMAAEVIAHTLELDLYCIDLSSVVSKYIGETEKNLRRLFNSAEDSGAILFFDEADALFGKRSEVKDSHDRYANIEINYLLQRIESYRGLAILATNMKSALDKAFVRRLRFIVDFPFPAIEERTEIWRRIFPSETPVDENLDCARLARLNLTGGNIHNVALNAAFSAARNNSKVTMPLVLNAARVEYKKLERPAKESDFIWQENLGVAI